MTAKPPTAAETATSLPVTLADIEAAAKAIEDAVGRVLDQGLRTPDIYSEGTTKVGTQAMGEAVVSAL